MKLNRNKNQQCCGSSGVCGESKPSEKETSHGTAKTTK